MNRATLSYLQKVRRLHRSRSLARRLGLTNPRQVNRLRARVDVYLISSSTSMVSREKLLCLATLVSVGHPVTVRPLPRKLRVVYRGLKWNSPRAGLLPLSHLVILQHKPSSRLSRGSRLSARAHPRARHSSLKRASSQHSTPPRASDQVITSHT